MDNRPIGVFDSGLGGLTCIPNLFRQLPEERVIYFGDTARTPYGSKAVSTVKAYTNQIADFLAAQNVKMMVIACNTISSTCLPDLRKRFPDIPILGIIEPAACRVAESCNMESRIGIIATKVTIASGVYTASIEAMHPGLSVFCKATPAFVPLIEEGIIDNEIMDLTIRYYMDDFVKENRLDTLVLGCTHYPLIRKNILKIYPQLKIVNPSYEIVEKVKQVLQDERMLAERNDRENIFYASDLSENFVNMIQNILDTEKSDLILKFKNLDL
ncbi:MAG: glutamate racemase [Firmicutes bacterium]|nr:glutamate racemase [Bacillota bacterium]MDD7601902.1 glutamate racemase [Bacillota bacterium]MDY5855918.1 glutamate racemase [Anaerovoracaceae bacterium]